MASAEATPEVTFAAELAQRFGEKAKVLPGETSAAYTSRMAFLGMLFVATKESLRELPGALALKQAIARGALVSIGAPEDAVPEVIFEKPRTLSEVRAIRKAAETKTVGYVDGAGHVVKVS